MALFSQPSGATRTALIYITIGSLLEIWTGVWFVYLRNHEPETDATYYYVCSGLLITGLVLIAIGLGLGQIGRASRPADVLHEEVPPVTAPAMPATMPATMPAVVVRTIEPNAPRAQDVVELPAQFAAGRNPRDEQPATR